jgi:PhzF family phenazine biosynthesis protein
METGRLYKLAAFANSPDGENPAGVWIGEKFPDDGIMQGIAAEVGFSETASVILTNGQHRVVRYFSPEIEVPFCRHATIAAGVFLGETEGDGTYILKTAVGEVPVFLRIRNGLREASLTSVKPKNKSNFEPSLPIQLDIFCQIALLILNPDSIRSWSVSFFAEFACNLSSPNSSLQTI